MAKSEQLPGDFSVSRSISLARGLSLLEQRLVLVPKLVYRAFQGRISSVAVLQLWKPTLGANRFGLKRKPR